MSSLDYESALSGLILQGNESYVSEDDALVGFENMESVFEQIANLFCPTEVTSDVFVMHIAVMVFYPSAQGRKEDVW